MTTMRIAASLWLAGVRSALEYRADFLIMTLIALFIRKPRVHEAIAPIMAVTVLIFIGMMFAKLGKLQ